MSHSVSSTQRYREMFNTDRVVEKLVKGGVFDFFLILHLDFQYFPLVHVSVADHIFGQIDARDWAIDFENLSQNE